MVTYERHNIRILMAFHDLYVSKATHNFISNNSKDVILVSEYVFQERNNDYINFVGLT